MFGSWRLCGGDLVLSGGSVSRLRGSPGLVAAVASFVIAELLTGSTRPLLLVTSPTVFGLIAALYGCGVLSVRELCLRWDGGWACLAALGGAFGVLEEGLVARSFFDPHWGDLGALAGYGRWAGVSWNWAMYLTVFHAVFSVTIPVALARLAVPARRDQPWLSRTARRRVAAGLIAVTVLGVLAVNPAAGPPVALAASALAVLALVLVARLLARSHRRPTARPRSPHSSRRLATLGFGGSAALFLVAWVTPSTPLPAAVALGLLALCVLLAAGVARRLAVAELDRKQQMALIGGALTWLALVDLAVAPVRPDTAALVAIGLTLLFVRRRTLAARRRRMTQPQPGIHQSRSR